LDAELWGAQQGMLGMDRYLRQLRARSVG